MRHRWSGVFLIRSAPVALRDLFRVKQEMCRATLRRLIIALVSRFAGDGGPDFSPEALSRLAAHTWPGNVRELQHTVEGAVAAASGPLVGPDDIRLA